MSEPDPAALERADAIAAALVVRARPVTIRVTANPSDVHAAQRLRAEAALERGWVKPDQLVDGLERDPADATALHLLAVLDGQPVGTLRLILPQGDATVVELGRLVARTPTGPGGSVSRGLLGRAWQEVRARGYCRISASGTLGMIRLVKRMGFRVEIVGAPRRHFGADRHPFVFEPGEPAAAAALTTRYRER